MFALGVDMRFGRFNQIIQSALWGVRPGLPESSDSSTKSGLLAPELRWVPFTGQS